MRVYNLASFVSFTSFKIFLSRAEDSIECALTPCFMSCFVSCFVQFLQLGRRVMHTPQYQAFTFSACFAAVGISMVIVYTVQVWTFPVAIEVPIQGYDITSYACPIDSDPNRMCYDGTVRINSTDISRSCVVLNVFEHQDFDYNATLNALQTEWSVGRLITIYKSSDPICRTRADSAPAWLLIVGIFFVLCSIIIPLLWWYQTRSQKLLLAVSAMQTTQNSTQV